MWKTPLTQKIKTISQIHLVWLFLEKHIEKLCKNDRGLVSLGQNKEIARKIEIGPLKGGTFMSIAAILSVMIFL